MKISQWLNKVMKVNKVIHLVNHLKNHRESVILTSLIVSIFSSWLLFIGNDYSHINNYLIGFYRSLSVFTVCSFGYYITNSKRLVGLLGFIITSMMFDLAYLTNDAYFYLLDGVRNTNKYNFADFFTAYELTCLTISLFIGLKYASERMGITGNDVDTGSSNHSIHQHHKTRK